MLVMWCEVLWVLYKLYDIGSNVKLWWDISGVGLYIFFDLCFFDSFVFYDFSDSCFGNLSVKGLLGS